MSEVTLRRVGTFALSGQLVLPTRGAPDHSHMSRGEVAG